MTSTEGDVVGNFGGKKAAPFGKRKGKAIRKKRSTKTATGKKKPARQTKRGKNKKARKFY